MGVKINGGWEISENLNKWRGGVKIYEGGNFVKNFMQQSRDHMIRQDARVVEYDFGGKFCTKNACAQV